MKYFPKYFISFVLFLAFIFPCEKVYGQDNHAIDSLEQKIKTAKGDELFLCYRELIGTFIISNPRRSIAYADRAIQKAPLMQNEKSLAILYFLKGKAQYFESDFPGATKSFLQFIDLDKSFHLADEEVHCYEYLGVIYMDLKDQKKSEEYFSQSRAIAVAAKDSELIASALMMSGIFYVDCGMGEKGLLFLRQARSYKINPASTFRTDLGFAFLSVGQLDSALECFTEALTYSEKYGDKNGMVEAYKGLGKTYAQKKEINKAIGFYEKGLEIVLGISKYGTDSQKIYDALTELYEAKGDYKTALKFNRLFMEGKDSLNTNKKFAELNGQFELEKQKLASENEKAIQKANMVAETKKQQLIIGFVSGGLLLVIVFSIFIFSRYRITQRQKSIIQKQKTEVDGKNKEILDSIHYAQRIQNSMMPTEKFINKSIERLNRNS